MTDFNPFGTHPNYKFSDVFGSAADFKTISDETGIPQKITDDNMNLLFYLLYARYGNSTIASWDTNQFIYKVFSTVFMYGPAWETRLEVQDKLIALSKTNELFDGSENIVNHAKNPSTAPGTDSYEALPFIDDQTGGKWKKGKVEGYALLLQVLQSDVTKEFIDKFASLFIKVVEPNAPLFYTTTPEEQEILEI